MAKSKTPKADAPTKAKPAVEKVSVLQRIPADILAGFDERVRRQGMSRNHGFILATLEWGDFTPAQRKAILARLDAEPVSLASKINTDLPPDLAPGARLDKKAIGKRLTPKAKPGRGGKPAEDEVII